MSQKEIDAILKELNHLLSYFRVQNQLKLSFYEERVKFVPAELYDFMEKWLNQLFDLHINRTNGFISTRASTFE